MPHIHQRKYRSHLHKIKRLNHTSRHGEQMMIDNFPLNTIDENFLNKSSKYTKYFDYPLPELLADHSTDPLQNTTRQYTNTSACISSEGRFANHEMIIRRNGETTILRPKQDLVLANGFTPVIRPSSLLPSYQSIMSHSQVASSLSIINKMSIKKPEQASIIKTKRKDRYRRKHIELNNSQDPAFIHLVQQALHEIIDEDKYLPPQPVPLMSILPQFHSPSPNYYNRSFTPPLEQPFFYQDPTQSSCFNEQKIAPLNNAYKESFYDYPPEQYRGFEANHQLHSTYPPYEHVCLQPLMSQERNYSHMSGYFFN